VNVHGFAEARAILSFYGAHLLKEMHLVHV